MREDSGVTCDMCTHKGVCAFYRERQTITPAAFSDVIGLSSREVWEHVAKREHEAVAEICVNFKTAIPINLKNEQVKR